MEVRVRSSICSCELMLLKKLDYVAPMLLSQQPRRGRRQLRRDPAAGDDGAETFDLASGIREHEIERPRRALEPPFAEHREHLERQRHRAGTVLALRPADDMVAVGALTNVDLALVEIDVA